MEHLERLPNNPDEPNPLEPHEDAALRQGLKDRGYIGMSQAQILAKRDDYIPGLKAGELPYSDKELYGVGLIPANSGRGNENSNQDFA